MPKVGRAVALCISHTPGKHLMLPDGAVTHFQVGGGVRARASAKKKKKKRGTLICCGHGTRWASRALYRFLFLFFSFFFLWSASLVLPHIYLIFFLVVVLLLLLGIFPVFYYFAVLFGVFQPFLYKRISVSVISCPHRSPECFFLFFLNIYLMFF